MQNNNLNGLPSSYIDLLFLVSSSALLLSIVDRRCNGRCFGFEGLCKPAHVRVQVQIRLPAWFKAFPLTCDVPCRTTRHFAANQEHGPSSFLSAFVLVCRHRDRCASNHSCSAMTLTPAAAANGNGKSPLTHSDMMKTALRPLSGLRVISTIAIMVCTRA